MYDTGSMVAQIAERATRDQKVPGLIPSWIQWDRVSKYNPFYLKLDLISVCRSNSPQLLSGYKPRIKSLPLSYVAGLR